MSLALGGGVALFTDGSSSPKDRSGGWAWCAIDSLGAQEMGSGAVSQTTNNRMEMQAWIEGLTWVYEDCGPADVLVYSDSQYVGLGVMDRGRSRVKNRDLWTALDGAIELHDSVEFVHVKGHGDSYYNCLVDKLAGEARKKIQKDK